MELMVLEWVTVTTPVCVMCGKAGTVRVDKAGYDRYTAGVLLQYAFPGLDAGVREQILTGTHPGCWELLMVGVGDDD